MLYIQETAIPGNEYELTLMDRIDHIVPDI